MIILNIFLYYIYIYIFKRLENSSAKPTTIQDRQTEINNLKKEVKELHQQQSLTHKSKSAEKKKNKMALLEYH